MARPRGFEPLTSASGVHRNTMVGVVLGGAKLAQINQMHAEDLSRSSPWGAGFSTISANFGHRLVR